MAGTIKHKNLTGAALHEPKGVADASAGQVYVTTGTGTGAHKNIATDANASETTMEPKGVSTAVAETVYVADGVGSGAWRSLPEFSGAMVITNNATAYTLTAAVDGTLNTFSDYIKMTLFSAGELDKLTFASNQLTIPTSGGGLYLVDTYMTIATNTVNTNVAIKFAINGASGVSRRPRSFLATTGNYYSLSANGLVRLADADVISLHIASDKTANITVQDCAFVLHKVGE